MQLADVAVFTLPSFSRHLDRLAAGLLSVWWQQTTCLSALSPCLAFKLTKQHWAAMKNHCKSRQSHAPALGLGSTARFGRGGKEDQENGSDLGQGLQGAGSKP